MPKYGWDNNDTIEHHSKVKLNLFESYLKDYLRTLCKHYKRETFKLTYVDGFAGGGKYKDEIFGSPLRAIFAIEDVQEEINEGRRNPIKFDIKYIFIDNNKQTIETLEKSIKDLYHDKYNIEFICGEFENQVDKIISFISKHTPSANRAIFFLDPYSYTDVSLSTLKKISKMEKCEVIWNVMIDHIIHYVSRENNIFNSSMAQIELENENIDELKEWILDNRKDGIVFLRHLICRYFHNSSNFKLASDFYLKQVTSNKFSTLLHLSDHLKSREVMLKNHWVHASHSVTEYHTGIGYTHHLYHTDKTDKQSGFDFTEDSRKDMREQGIEKIYNEIKDGDVVPFELVQYRMAQNYSALTNDDYKEIIKPHNGLIGFDKNGTPTKSIDKIKAVKRNKQKKFYFPENKKKR